MQVNVNVKRATNRSASIGVCAVFILTPLNFLLIDALNLMDLIVGRHGNVSNFFFGLLYSFWLSTCAVLLVGAIFSGALRIMLPEVRVMLRQWEKRQKAEKKPAETSDRVFAVALIVAIAAVFSGVCALFEFFGPLSGWPYFLWAVASALLVWFASSNWNEDELASEMAPST